MSNACEPNNLLLITVDNYNTILLITCGMGGSAAKNRWEICLRMRYNLRGIRERDLGRVNIVI